MALAVVVVLAAVGYFVRNSFSTGAKTTGSAQAVALKPPGCTTQTAKATQLKHVGSHMVATGGSRSTSPPFRASRSCPALAAASP